VNDTLSDHNTTSPNVIDLPTGKAAAAILAAGVGSAALGVLALTADALPTAKQFLTFYRPTGALSGVTTTAIIVWLGVWFALAQRWHARQIELKRIHQGALVLLVVGILLTFPPFMDFLQGK
jgi:hypothetical protein